MPSALLASQIEAIRLLDKRIDGVRLELLRRVRVNILDAGSWQLAWDRNPDIDRRHDALFRLRGIAQDTRDLIIEREYQAAQRRERALRRKGLGA